MEKLVFGAGSYTLKVGDKINVLQYHPKEGFREVELEATADMLDAIAEGAKHFTGVDLAGGGTHTDLEYYFDHLAERIGWKPENLDKYLTNLIDIYPAAACSILLREVAIVLDEKYPDHIERSKEIWTISMTDGEIKKVKDLNRIKNFRNFAAFRTLDDARAAKHIMKPFMKQMYGRK